MLIGWILQACGQTASDTRWSNIWMEADRRAHRAEVLTWISAAAAVVASTVALIALIIR